MLFEQTEFRIIREKNTISDFGINGGSGGYIYPVPGVRQVCGQ
jgi:hypothetical protein